WQAVAEVAEAEVAERRIDPLADLGRRHLAQLQAVADVVKHRPVRPERVRLEDQAEVAPFGGQLALLGGVEDRPVFDPDRAAVWRLESGDGAQQRRLAAARRTE